MVLAQMSCGMLWAKYSRGMEAENFAQILQNIPHCSQFMSLCLFEPNMNFRTAVGSGRVRNYHYSPRNNPEERSSHLLRSRGLKSRTNTNFIKIY